MTVNSVSFGDSASEESVPKFCDKVVGCADCLADFTIYAGEQYFFWRRQWPEPRRCPKCRRLRKLAIQGQEGQ